MRDRTPGEIRKANRYRNDPTYAANKRASHMRWRANKKISDPEYFDRLNAARRQILIDDPGYRRALNESRRIRYRDDHVYRESRQAASRRRYWKRKDDF